MEYPVSAQFGQTDSFHFEPHSGLDLATPIGTPVQSPEDNATVLKVASTEKTGISISLKLTNDKEVSFSHLSKTTVVEGQKVNKGDIIAFSGNTGTLTTGPHVHVTLRQHDKVIDPLPYLNGATSSGFSVTTMLILLVLSLVAWRLKRYIAYGMIAGLGLLLLLAIGMLDSM